VYASTVIKVKDEVAMLNEVPRHEDLSDA